MYRDRRTEILGGHLHYPLVQIFHGSYNNATEHQAGDRGQHGAEQKDGQCKQPLVRQKTRTRAAFLATEQYRLDLSGRIHDWRIQAPVCAILGPGTVVCLVVFELLEDGGGQAQFQWPPFLALF